MAQGFQKLESREKGLSACGGVKVDTGSYRDGLDDCLALDPELVRDMERARPGVRRAMLQRKRVILQRAAMRTEGHGSFGRLTFDMRGGRQLAKPDVARPLDGRVGRHLPHDRRSLTLDASRRTATSSEG